MAVETPHAGHQRVREFHAKNHPGADVHRDLLGETVDVSNNNGSVDWPAVHDQGHKKLAIAKLTEGVSFNDPTFTVGRRDAIVGAGLVPAVYHFARPDNNSGRDEADHFLNRCRALSLKPIGLRAARRGERGWVLVYDFEQPPFDIGKARDFADRIHDQAGVRPILYGYGQSINPLVPILDLFSGVDFAAYVADWHQYWNGPDEAVVLWQFTSRGRCPGISGDVDLSHYLVGA